MLKNSTDAINWMDDNYITDGVTEGVTSIVVPNCDLYEAVHNLIKLCKNDKCKDNGFIQFFKQYMPDTESEFLDDNIYYDDQIITCTHCGELIYHDYMGGTKGSRVGECDYWCKSCIHDAPQDYMSYLISTVGTEHKHCNTLLEYSEIKDLGFKVIDFEFESGRNYNNTNIEELDKLVQEVGGFYTLQGSNPGQDTFKVVVPQADTKFETKFQELVK
jgi:hypothetical protein